MHLAQYAQLQGVRCAALAELRPQLAEQVAKQYCVANLYSDHYQLLEQADIDAVVIVTHRNHTSKVAFDCLQAQKHVFSEKPMAKTYAQALTLCEQAQAVERRYIVGYQKRHDEGVLAAKQRLHALCEGQQLGELREIQVWNYTGQDRDYNKPFQMTDEPRGSGVGQWGQSPAWLLAEHQALYDRFVNVFCHDINIIHFLTGQPISVVEANLHDQHNIQLRLCVDDIPVTMQGSLRELQAWDQRGQWREGITFVFANGSLSVRFPGPLFHGVCAQVVEQHLGGKTLIHSGKVVEPVFFRQAQSFVRHIQQCEPNNAQANDCKNDLLVIEQVWEKFQQSNALKK